ncbi:peptidoglycan-binding domain-containing protein [Marinobacter halotolerans]|uniref:peptidoglycan-binding domain-containing protein n=1 Tax=Marinobacter halotolerans TaxID=1569211 RepID=UPI00178354E4|nr:peptidoglycan-binding domain-containing protein [Marinobacter halotolerans]
MRRRLAVAPVLKGACLSAALTACSIAQAASVQAVFSAENALYGAGYSIGQADGWIDDSFRQALRKFQADRPGLAATGELDSDTLNALGISGQSSELMGGNVVASREAARKELGLVAASLAKPAPRTAPEPQPRSRPEPQPEPEPVVAAVSAPVPEPEPKPAPEPVVVEKAAPVVKKAPETRSEPEPEPQVVTAPPEPAKPEANAQTPVQKQPESEPTSEPIQIASITRSDNQPIDKNKPEAKQADAEDAGDKSVEVAGDDVNDVASMEATQGVQQAAERPLESSSPERPASSESSGNFLTKMFDFLFGWMV